MAKGKRLTSVEMIGAMLIPALAMIGCALLGGSLVVITVGWVVGQ